MERRRSFVNLTLIKFLLWLQESHLLRQLRLQISFLQRFDKRSIRRTLNELTFQGINIRIMDPFTIKPLDITAVQDNAAACNGRVITVEDHYPEGGIGDAVLDAVSSYRNMIVKKLAVNAVPRSGVT